MITNAEEWKQFEDNYNANQKIDFYKNLETFNKMLELAIELKVFPKKNPLEGIEYKIHLARILNGYPNFEIETIREELKKEFPEYNILNN
ncbi:MAG: hypothetical protein HZB41_07090 [Ignavibacteriae bacterium]|nr:hypothetical protein [Ignavibacteriota bacterium]